MKACAVKGEISLKEFSSLNEAEEYEDDEDDWWRGRGEGDREDVAHEAGVRRCLRKRWRRLWKMNEFALSDFARIDERKGWASFKGNSHIANIATTTTTATTTTAITTRVRALT